jgi:hypothetical protein
MSTDIFLYLYLFLQISLFIMLGFILYNMYLKSYKPQNSISWIVLILVMFILNGLIATGSASLFVGTLNTQINGSTDQIKF